MAAQIVKKIKKTYKWLLTISQAGLTIALIILVLPYQLTAQTSAPDSIKSMPTWGKVVAAGALLGTGWLLDKPAWQWSKNHPCEFGHRASEFSDALGEKTIVVPALLTTFAGSYLLKDEKLKTTSWTAIKSVALTAMATEGIKIMAGRQRPFVEGDHNRFSPFNTDDRYKSMPSGHTSLAFAIFTPFAEKYSRWIYLVPATVAIGRVYQQKHWLTDVMVGGGLGWISGYLLTHSNKKIVIGPGGLVIWF